jgi:hypothetical protein
MNALAPPHGHSSLGMSVLPRRNACPGSYRLEQGRPDRPSPYAQRGTVLHAVAATCLSDGSDPVDVLGDDDEGIDIIQAWLDVVRAAHARLGGTLLIEHLFSLTALDQRYWGTADAVIIAPPVLWVGDLKTGAGHPVPVRQEDGRVNFQLGGYGLGALQSIPPGVVIERIELCVVQPRREAVLETVMDIGEAIDLTGTLDDIAHAVDAPDAPLVPGDHCLFCRARGECPALRAQALSDASADFADPPLPASLDPEELGYLLGRAEVVDLWVAALREHAKALADGGTPIPGWKLVNRRGRRVWADEPAAAEALEAARLPDEDRIVTKLISPTQAEKAFKRLRLRPPATWNDLVVMTDPGTSLVPEADRRPAVAGRSPALDFHPENPEEPS